MRALVSIAGHDIPDPSVYNATTSTIVDNGRNAEGKLVGAVIRDSMAKIECSWKYLPAATWAEILSLFNVSLGGSFTNPVTFFNQDTNDWETREMYVSDKTAECFSVISMVQERLRGLPSAGLLWWRCSLCKP